MGLLFLTYFMSLQPLKGFGRSLYCLEYLIESGGGVFTVVAKAANNRKGARHPARMHCFLIIGNKECVIK